MRPDPDAGPDPAQAQTAAEFVAMLRALRQWSGLTFRQIERRATANGDALPHSTVSTALSRATLPREELVAAIVRAIGCDKETVELWAASRRRLAAAAELPQPVVAAPPPHDEDEDQDQWWPPPEPVTRATPIEPLEPVTRATPIAPPAPAARATPIAPLEPPARPTPVESPTQIAGEAEPVAVGPQVREPVAAVMTEAGMREPVPAWHAGDAQTVIEPWTRRTTAIEDAPGEEAAPCEEELPCEEEAAAGEEAAPCQEEAAGEARAPGEEKVAGEAGEDLPPLGIRSREYSDGALAAAVHKRQHSDTWVGLHRRTTATGGDDERADRFGLKDLVPPIVLRAGWSTRVMLGVLAIVLILIAAGAIVGGLRKDIVADPPGEDVCCLDDDQYGDPGSPSPSQTPSPVTSPTGTGAAAPIVNPKPTPTPTTATPQQPRPTPTTPSQTPPQAQNPQLTGTANAICVRRGQEWWVDIPVSASLSGASSGTSPTAMAGQADSMRSFPLGGSGTTSFSGQTSVYIAPYSEFASVFGNIQWSVTVSVPSGAKIGTSGRESFRCN